MFYFIGEHAALSQHLEAKAEAKREQGTKKPKKKTIEMFHFGQMGEESSQEVLLGRLIDDPLLTGGCRKGGAL